MIGVIVGYEAEKMQELLQSFYTLTNIRIVVFNDQLDKIAEMPQGDCAFCALVREEAATEELCTRSDREACQVCRRSNQMHSYVCHAGLTETVTPIFHGTLVIGYLMFGQVLNAADAEAYWPKVEQSCGRYGLDMAALRAAYDQITPVALEKVYAAAQILEACAGYLWLQKYVTLKEDDFLTRLDAYITGNLHADLSVSALCRQFNIGRSKLYKTMGGYYGCGVEQLTRVLRVKKAKDLLETTTEPVSAIANLVGYSDYNYFIKVFKSEAGKTPNQYRKEHRLLSRE